MKQLNNIHRSVLKSFYSFWNENICTLSMRIIIMRNVWKKGDGDNHRIDKTCIFKNISNYFVYILSFLLYLSFIFLMLLS